MLSTLENNEGLSKMDNPEKRATLGTKDEQKHNVRWIVLSRNKHK